MMDANQLSYGGNRTVRTTSNLTSGIRVSGLGAPDKRMSECLEFENKEIQVEIPSE